MRSLTPSLAQLVEVVGDLRRDEEAIAAAELGDPLAGAQEFRDPFLQLAIDLGDRRRELIGVSGEQFLDAGERHARIGERLDLNQGDGVPGAVTPVTRRVARRLLEQAALVVMADGLDRHARVFGELTDGDRLLRSRFSHSDCRLVRSL